MLTKYSLHQQVTNDILKAMVNATDFEMPWHCQSGLPVNFVTENTYRGVNILSLWSAAISGGYSSNHWATYKQWKSVGGQVRKGQKGRTIVFYDHIPDKDEEGEYKIIIKSSKVFNADQVHSVPETEINSEGAKSKKEHISAVEKYVLRTRARVDCGGRRAYYSTDEDIIVVPEWDCFTGTSTSSPVECYYSTLLHELTHWTGHKERCIRDMSNRFGTDGYAMEELIAELGSAFLCAELNITPTPRQDHANYLAHWIKVLENDPKAIFWASARASEAVVYLNSLQKVTKLPAIR